MVSTTPDLIVVGAGAAGLSAAIKVARCGFSVQIVEARSRIGGRMCTVRDPVWKVPIELGAEFIHGLPPELWKPLERCQSDIAEVIGEPWCSLNGRLSRCKFFSSVESILNKMHCRGKDESFLNFLDRRFPESTSSRKQEARKRALAYVSGFNAADPNKVGVHWLVESMRAEEKIAGDRAFRSRNGYDDLLDIFRQELIGTGVRVQTETVVKSIAWSRGRALVTTRQDRKSLRLVARCVLVTLPLGVLQAPVRDSGAIRFSPDLPLKKLEALKTLQMGKAFRVTLRFRTRFWATMRPDKNSSETLSHMNYLFTQDDWFPTWWTKMPDKLPIITGWAPACSAERLSGKSLSFAVKQALRSLGSALKIRPGALESLLEDAYCHDWQNDPFSRGAYSYGAVGSDGAQRDLGSPLENTLFFAGEATDTTGHNGTVHGAITSGHRAASQILRGLRQARRKAAGETPAGPAGSKP
jgi:monoamine oxidase